MKEVKVFQLPNGRVPFEEWVQKLSDETRAMIDAYVDRVAIGGGKKNIRALAEGVFEIKINRGPGWRVYFGEVGIGVLFYFYSVVTREPKIVISRRPRDSGGCMHRSNSYNERFSREIRNPKYARAYILELLKNPDEPMQLEEVLRLIAKKMGTTDFAQFVCERVQNIDKFINGERHPKRETLDKFLRPFGLETVLGIRSVDEDKVA